MNGKKVSAALNALPEEMVAEAMEPGHRGRGVSWLRLAACVAIIVGLFFGFWPAEPEIVTAPGLLTLTVYAMDSTSNYTSVELTEGISVPESRYIPLGLSIMPGIPVVLSVETEDFSSDQIIFNISATCGMYIATEGTHSESYTTLYKEFTCRNNDAIYWTIDSFDKTIEFADEAYDHVFTSIIICYQEHIIGYAVVRFDRLYGKEFVELDPFFSDVYNDDDPVAAYYAELVESVSFPKVNGEYQNVSEEYVNQCIQEIVTMR